MRTVRDYIIWEKKDEVIFRYFKSFESIDYIKRIFADKEVEMIEARDQIERISKLKYAFDVAQNLELPHEYERKRGNV